MARRRYPDKGVLNLLRRIDLSLASGSSRDGLPFIQHQSMRYIITGAIGTAGWASYSLRSSRVSSRRIPGSRELLQSDGCFVWQWNC